MKEKIIIPKQYGILKPIRTSYAEIKDTYIKEESVNMISAEICPRKYKNPFFLRSVQVAP